MKAEIVETIEKKTWCQYRSAKKRVKSLSDYLPHREGLHDWLFDRFKVVAHLYIFWVCQGRVRLPFTTKTCTKRKQRHTKMRIEERGQQRKKGAYINSTLKLTWWCTMLSYGFYNLVFLLLVFLGYQGIYSFQVFDTYFAFTRIDKLFLLYSRHKWRWDYQEGDDWSMTTMIIMMMSTWGKGNPWSRHAAEKGRKEGEQMQYNTGKYLLYSTSYIQQGQE